MNEKKIVIICSAVILLLSIDGLYKKYSADNYKKSSLFLYDRPLIDWVKENTPKNAQFLIPPYFYSWQGTGRPAFYDPNIINTASYNKAYIMDAIKRFQILMSINLKDINLEEPPKMEIERTWSASSFQREKYDAMMEDNILEIKKSYGIKYFITSSKNNYSFPIVYQNNKYKIYNLD